MDSQPTQSSDVMKHCYDNLIVVDVGANLTNKKYSRDLDSVVQRAKDSGKSISINVTKVILSYVTDLSLSNHQN